MPAGKGGGKKVKEGEGVEIRMKGQSRADLSRNKFGGPSSKMLGFRLDHTATVPY